MAYGIPKVFLENLICSSLFLYGKFHFIKRQDKAYSVVHIPEVFIIDDEVLSEISVDNVAVVVILVDKVADKAFNKYLLVLCIIRHADVAGLNGCNDMNLVRINDFAVLVQKLVIFVSTAAFNELCQADIKLFAGEFETMIFVHVYVEEVGVVLRKHECRRVLP